MSKKEYCLNHRKVDFNQAAYAYSNSFSYTEYLACVWILQPLEWRLFISMITRNNALTSEAYALTKLQMHVITLLIGFRISIVYEHATPQYFYKASLRLLLYSDYTTNVHENTNGHTRSVSHLHYSIPKPSVKVICSYDCVNSVLSRHFHLH